MTIVFSILRSIALSFLVFFSQVLPGPVGILNPLAPLEKFDVFIVDQQSVCVPFLRALTGTPVVFYCHFPDKLLSGGWVIDSSSSPGNVSLSRQNAPLLKRLYRWPIDRLEEWTTGTWEAQVARSHTPRPIGRDPLQLAIHVPGVCLGVQNTCQTHTKGRVPRHRRRCVPEGCARVGRWCRAGHRVSLAA